MQRHVLPTGVPSFFSQGFRQHMLTEREIRHQSFQALFSSSNCRNRRSSSLPPPTPFVKDRRSRQFTLVLNCRRFRKRRQSPQAVRIGTANCGRITKTSQSEHRCYIFACQSHQNP
jgi:hypothetical protein